MKDMTEMWDLPLMPSFFRIEKSGMVVKSGVDGGSQNFSGLEFGSDYSKIGNLPTGHDFFMRLCDNQTVPPIWGAPIPAHCKMVPDIGFK